MFSQLIFLCNSLIFNWCGVVSCTGFAEMKYLKSSWTVSLYASLISLTSEKKLCLSPQISGCGMPWNC